MFVSLPAFRLYFAPQLVVTDGRPSLSRGSIEDEVKSFRSNSQTSTLRRGTKHVFVFFRGLTGCGSGFISQESAHFTVAILRERKWVSCLPSKFLKSRTRELPLFPPRITLEARALYAVPPAPSNPTRSDPQLSVSINPILSRRNVATF